MKTQIFNAQTLHDEDIALWARALEEGALAVFATDTVYGLGTGAFCETAVQKIYNIKQRPSAQPLQLLAAHVEQVRKWAQFSPEAKRVAQAYWPGGLTLILPPLPQGERLLRGAAGLGFRVPAYEPLRHILAHMQGPLCSTSANLHGQPVLTQEAQVLETFDGQVDYILLGGTLSPVASTVLDATGNLPVCVREGSILKTDLQRVWNAQ